MSLLIGAPGFKRRVRNFKTVFNPLTLSPTAWYDAADDDSITLDGSGLVEQWNDKSGNGYHVGQTTASSRPSRISNGVQFSNPDGESTDPTAAEYLTRSGRILTAYPFTMVAVIDNVSHTGDNEGPVFSDGISGSAATYSFIGSRGDDRGISTRRSPTIYRAEHLADWSGGARNLLYGTFQGDESISSVNDSDSPSVNAESVTLSASAGDIWVGVNRTPSGLYPANSLNGTVREILIFDRLVTDEEAATIREYLNEKWSIYSPVFPSTAYRDMILSEPSLLIYHRLSETYLGWAYDYSGNGNHGEYFDSPLIQQAGLVSGDNNPCVDFSGGGYILPADTGGVSSLTFEKIIGPLTGTGEQRVYDWQDSSGFFILRPNVPSAGRIQALCQAGSNITVDAAIDFGVGHHIAVNQTASGGDLELWIDGVLAASTAIAGAFSGTGTARRIGRTRNSTANQTQAKVDEFAVYSPALSQARIEAHAGQAGY